MKPDTQGSSSLNNYNPLFRTAYSAPVKVRLSFPPEEGRTKQSFKDECDINVLMKRYEQTGTLEHIQKREALYIDVTREDFQAAMDIIANANTAFAELPASVRERFDNDPELMLGFVEDRRNLEEAAELGLLSPESVQALAKERDANTGAAAVAAAVKPQGESGGGAPPPPP